MSRKSGVGRKTTDTYPRRDASLVCLFPKEIEGCKVNVSVRTSFASRLPTGTCSLHEGLSSVFSQRRWEMTNAERGIGGRVDGQVGGVGGHLLVYFSLREKRELRQSKRVRAWRAIAVRCAEAVEHRRADGTIWAAVRRHVGGSTALSLV